MVYVSCSYWFFYFLLDACTCVQLYLQVQIHPFLSHVHLLWAFSAWEPAPYVSATFLATLMHKLAYPLKSVVLDPVSYNWYALAFCKTITCGCSTMLMDVTVLDLVLVHYSTHLSCHYWWELTNYMHPLFQVSCYRKGGYWYLRQPIVFYFWC